MILRTSENKHCLNGFCLELSEVIEKQILSMMIPSTTNPNYWSCTGCGKESRSKRDLGRHIESVHIADHPGFNCNYCDKHMRSSNALRLHMSKFHPYSIK